MSKENEGKAKMKKEIILSIVILLAIIIGDLIITNNIHSKIDGISERLDKLSEKVEEENKEELENDFEEIENDWTKIDENFSYYVEHNELEKVWTEMKSLKSYISSEEWAESKNEIAKLDFILEHIKNKMDLKLKNVF